jgi:hypothetical protein
MAVVIMDRQSVRSRNLSSVGTMKKPRPLRSASILDSCISILEFLIISTMDCCSQDQKERTLTNSSESEATAIGRYGKWLEAGYSHHNDGKNCSQKKLLPFCLFTTKSTYELT